MYVHEQNMTRTAHRWAAQSNKKQWQKTRAIDKKEIKTETKSRERESVCVSAEKKYIKYPMTLSEKLCLRQS